MARGEAWWGVVGRRDRAWSGRVRACGGVVERGGAWLGVIGRDGVWWGVVGRGEAWLGVVGRGRA